MKYLFWNTHNNQNINPVLCDLIIENDISIVVLAEYAADINDLHKLLSIRGVSMINIPTVGCERIHMLGVKGVCVEPQLQTDRFSFQIINNCIILCGVHLNSNLFYDNVERREIDIVSIIDNIIYLEGKLNTKNTIIVGDFNCNPYDNSCVSARYFHGIPIYEESAKEYRIVAGRQFHMFYNPMWNFLGDFKEPYGTYYRSSADTVNPYWNVFDQVIIRPILRNRFINDSLKILTETENVSLLDRHRRPNRDISDHLPIMFEIKEDNCG